MTYSIALSPILLGFGLFFFSCRLLVFISRRHLGDGDDDSGSTTDFAGVGVGLFVSMKGSLHIHTAVQLASFLCFFYHIHDIFLH